VRHHLLGIVAPLAVVDHHRRAVTRQPHRDCAAKAAGRPGHQRHSMGY
jgi:hypothetical protein